MSARNKTPKHNTEAIASARALLSKVGLRMTGARMAVMRWLQDAKRPATHAEIAEDLVPLGFDKATVYRNLTDLAEAGLVTRSELGDHVWRFDNGIEVPGSAAPAYLGNANCVDPEGAMVAALSSCHMLTFLALAANKGFTVDSYEDAAVGHLGKNANGKMALLSVDLHPNIAFSGAKLPAQADLDWLHDKAHKECFIANSVLTEVHVVAV